jgi:hypothetical protein
MLVIGFCVMSIDLVINFPAVERSCRPLFATAGIAFKYGVVVVFCTNVVDELANIF